MKNKLLLSSLFAVFSFLTVYGQTATPTPTRPRVIIVGNPTPTPVRTNTPIPVSTPTPAKVVIISNNLPSPSPTPFATPKQTPFPSSTPSVTTFPQSTPTPTPVSFRSMPYGQLKTKIADAKKLMQSRPIMIAMTDSSLTTDILRVAYWDWKTSQIDFVILTKTVFLEKGLEFPTTSSNGKYVTVKILRANGVNTAITIIDSNSQAHTPLVVQYPIERNGTLSEMAYYVSTHPGVVTPEVVNAGKLYVANTIDIARDKLREKGIYITPRIADMAERLATVEHVDHGRFRNEYHPTIFNDIFTLYALNEGTTYRYSVSRAGAGGMVQMIPWTYSMIRSKYPNLGLMPDFVEGMRNHVNASQAMLLYMQMTWNEITSSSTVANALDSGIATPEDLMAAGYNSNPSRLASYIRRGGANWRNLIPNETKIYLQIYASIQRFVPMTPRTK